MYEELELTMDLFKEAFASTWAQESNYLGILVSVNGDLEVIINGKENYEKKLAYYSRAYTKNLRHKADNNVQIIDFTFEENYADIEENLLGAYK